MEILPGVAVRFFFAGTLSDEEGNSIPLANSIFILIFWRTATRFLSVGTM